MIELLCYNWRFANFWLEIRSPWPNLPVKVSNRSITGYHLNTFTIRISLHFSSAQEFQMGNFQKYWSQNVGQDFIVLTFSYIISVDFSLLLNSWSLHMLSLALSGSPSKISCKDKVKSNSKYLIITLSWRSFKENLVNYHSRIQLFFA